jgi:hypothetical protein
MKFSFFIFLRIFSPFFKMQKERFSWKVISQTISDLFALFQFLREKKVDYEKLQNIFFPSIFSFFVPLFRKSRAFCLKHLKLFCSNKFHFICCTFFAHISNNLFFKSLKVILCEESNHLINPWNKKANFSSIFLESTTLKSYLEENFTS